MENEYKRVVFVYCSVCEQVVEKTGHEGFRNGMFICEKCRNKEKAEDQRQWEVR